MRNILSLSCGLTKFVFLLVIVLAATTAALAQSGSRTGASSPSVAGGNAGSNSVAGSAERGSQSPVGLQGYCPVCLVEMRQWVKGDPRLAIDFDGKKYFFPGTEQAEKFERDPLKYVPVLGGDDVVQFARTSERVDGKLNFGVIHQGRTYFFASEENKRRFQASPESYENADLALGGDCIVCRADMKQRVPGKPEFITVYRGIRYQFLGQEQQAAFVKSPAHYADSLPAAPGQMPAGSSSRSSAPPPQTNGGSGTR